MSQLPRFIEEARKNSELQSQLKVIQTQPVEEQLEALAILAAKNGTPISAEEWRAYLAAKTISDDDLNQIAGGLKIPNSQVQPT